TPEHPNFPAAFCPGGPPTMDIGGRRGAPAMPATLVFYIGLCYTNLDFPSLRSACMSQRIYLNGRFVDPTDARISVFDHGFLYGDGVFEGIRAYNGRAFRLPEHVQRLYRSAKAIMLDVPLAQEEFAQVILEACRLN